MATDHYREVSASRTFDRLMQTIVSFVRSLIDLGTGKGNSAQEDKKVRYLNIYAVCWQVVVVVATSYNLLADMFHWDEHLFLFGTFAVCALAMVLQRFQRYTLARVLVLVMSILHVYLYANVFLPGVLMELYIIFPLILVMMLFENLYLYLAAMVVAALVMFIPNFYFHHYDFEMFNGVTNPIYFVVLFFAIYFFKYQNQKSEELLGKQKDEVLQQMELIETQRKELEELNRFQSKFFVNISHELRTPLTLINGLAEQLPTEENTSRGREVILQQTRKMKGIVDDIIDVSRTKFDKLELNLEKGSIDALLVRIHAAFLPAFDAKGMDLVLELGPHECLVSMDMTYLERALNNVVHNSLKYSAEGETVRIGKSVEGEEVLIRVKDQGVGIAEADLPRVFERFYQGKNEMNKTGGSGIGLSFTKDIILLHGGDVEVFSPNVNGTEVVMALPVLEVKDSPCVVKDGASGDALTEGSEDSANMVSGGKKVLIVDDHAEMRSYVASLLPQMQVVQAENGKQALELLGEQQVDYIITDFMMPVMDGYELVKSIKEQGMDTPILMLTARVDLEGKLDLLRLGVDDYMNKPFNRQELVARVERGLKNYESRRAYQADGPIEPEKVEDPFLTDLRAYIEENCSRLDFCLDDICDEFALSTSSLYRKVKTLTGLSSNAFVREVRLQSAKELADSGKYSTHKELGYAVGFSKTAYFVGLFERHFGKKPFSDQESLV